MLSSAGVAASLLLLRDLSIRGGAPGACTDVTPSDSDPEGVATMSPAPRPPLIIAGSAVVLACAAGAVCPLAIRNDPCHQELIEALLVAGATSFLLSDRVDVELILQLPDLLARKLVDGSLGSLLDHHSSPSSLPDSVVSGSMLLI